MEDPVVRRKWCTVWARLHECEYHKVKMEDQCAHACQLIRSGMLKQFDRTLIAWSVMHYNQIQNVDAEEVAIVCSLINLQRSNHEIWTLERASNEPLSILLQDGLGLIRYCPEARSRLLTLKAPEGTGNGRSLAAPPSAPPSYFPSVPQIGHLPVLISTLSAWLSTEWHAPAWLILALAVLVGGMLSQCASASSNGKRTKDTKPTGHHSHGSRSHGGKVKGAGGTRSPRMGST